jgi:hypothetical protein
MGSGGHKASSDGLSSKAAVSLTCRGPGILGATLQTLLLPTPFPPPRIVVVVVAAVVVVVVVVVVVQAWMVWLTDPMLLEVVRRWCRITQKALPPNGGQQ